MKIIVNLLAVAAVLSALCYTATAQDRTCTNGMEFTNCGTACPPTCENPNPLFCTGQCVIGCACPRGTVLHNGGCIQASQCPGGCPPGVPIFQCLTDPCTGASCPGVPGATCRANYCGGCNAVFYNSTGHNVTNRCSTTSTCPPGIPIVRCLTDPCTGATCPGVPGATCRANYCGGCNAVFYNSTGHNVTNRCTTQPTCTNGMVYSTCGSACNLTCNNYRNPPVCSRQCVARCQCPRGTVLHNGECTATSKCPTTDVCTLPPAVGDCDALVPRWFFNSTARICQRFYWGGCGGNGNNFTNGTQCLLSCGNPCATVRCGYPVCPNGDMPRIPEGQCCPRCPNPPTCPNGVTPATCFSDPCLGRTCSNILGARCRINFCGGLQCSAEFYDPAGNIVTDRCTTSTDVCTLPPSPGICQAAFRRWFYNSTAGVCQRFTWGGCGGNENNFMNGSHCLQRCLSGCDTISCVRPNCPNGERPVTPEGQCCPQCPTPICPGGVPPIPCLPNPCEGRTCPNVPDAQCRVNYCGWCSSDFYDSNGNNVTARCTSVPERPIPIQAEVCPPVPDATDDLVCTTQVRVCPTSGCADGLKCCPHICGGNTCVEPLRVPYYEIPLQCPLNISQGQRSTCPAPDSDNVNSCQSDASCRNNQLCCRSICGRMCTTPVNATQPCYAILGAFNRSLSGGFGAIAGAYIPQCSDEGTFQPIQCHGSTGYCWCVHTRTGQPLSPPIRGRPQCPLNCTYNRNTYYPGQTYASTDGCNDCWCTDTGVTACTRRACIDVCSLTSDPGPCRASIPAYYYDRQTDSCRSFTYGGCEGNRNRFSNIRDCLSRCDSDSRCLLRRDPGPCEALVPSYFFNATSGQCERFNYGGCQGNENRFPTAGECQRACDPSNRCANLPCPLPPCPESQQVRIPGECCPQCRIQECRDDQFLCSNGTCIEGSYRCDRLRDCPNGEDEADCPPPQCNVTCGDRTCVQEDHVCDGVLDCRDGSDARNCPVDFENTFFPETIPRQCPNATNLIGSCVEHCSSHDDCGNDALCCSNGCGSTCMRGEPVTPLCPALLSQTDNRLIGAFVPSCERDGSFSQVQCHGSTGYCWCVDTITGEPQSDGVRGDPNCGGCMDRNGIMYTYGETFVADDGCNTCHCSPNGTICTRIACAPDPCMIKDITIQHNKTFSDECSQCHCQFGQMSCQKRPCPIIGNAPDLKPTNVRMTFDGKLSEIAPTDEHKEGLKREVKRKFVENYEDSLGFSQDQIKNIELKEGSVIVIVSLNGTESTDAAGANLTLLLSQLEQDYMRRFFVIRYNSYVLEPTGDFQVGEEEEVEGEFPWWGILVICVGSLIIISVIVIVAIGILVKGGSRRRENGSVAYSKDNFYVDVKPSKI